MITRRYWKWQIIRNLPLAMAVGGLIATSGVAVLDAIPPKFTASSLIVLQRQSGADLGSKAQRTSEEVQHLRAVIHKVTSVQRLDSNAELKIETSRDKPTYLQITASEQSAEAALDSVLSLAKQSVAVSETSQLTKSNEKLDVLHRTLEEKQSQLSVAKEALSNHRLNAPMTDVEDLRVLASKLQATSVVERSLTNPNSKNINELYEKLAAARGLYSNIHPKVKLILARIDRARSQPDHGDTDSATHTNSIARLKEVEMQLAAHLAYKNTESELTHQLTITTDAANKAEEQFATASHISNAQKISLQVVQDAALSGRDPYRVRLAALCAIVVAAVSGAGGVVVLRIRTDRRLRRPQDLHNALGLTPFTTIPDLGPSLG